MPEPSSFIKENWKWLLTTLVIPAVMYGWPKVEEGIKAEAKLEVKDEIDEAYNEALRDAIVFRAKYESCCAAED